MLESLLSAIETLSAVGLGATVLAATRLHLLERRGNLETRLSARLDWYRRAAEAGRGFVDGSVDALGDALATSIRALVRAAFAATLSRAADRDVRFAEARSVLQDALRAPRSDSWAWDGGLYEHALYHGVLAELHLLRGERELAVPYAERCHRLGERALGIYEPVLAGDLASWGARLMGASAACETESARWFAVAVKLAREVVDQVDPTQAEALADAHFALASALACVGRYDEAFDALTAAAKQGFALPHRLVQDFELAPLRGDVRYQRVLRRVRSNADAVGRRRTAAGESS